MKSLIAYGEDTMKEKKDCENFNRVLNVVLNNMKSYEKERTLDVGEELDKILARRKHATQDVIDYLKDK